VTDAYKLLLIGNFLNNEAIRLEDAFKVTLSYRTGQYRNVDQLDMLELIQLLDRLEYFRELDAVISNILDGGHRPRPRWKPLDRKPR